jgi:alpha-glucosidase (family GH31 glycosyl hydrolase)
MNVFLGYENGTLLVSQVWPGITYYPDFSHPNATEWFTRQAAAFHQEIPFDGLWIDMNEPSNFLEGSEFGCNNNTLNEPPYNPRIYIEPGSPSTILYSKTACMDTKHFEGLHYNVHNLYGYFMSRVTHDALSAVFPGKRTMIVSRSQYAGSQRYATHWLGDNFSSWISMRDSIPTVLEYGMFGYPFVGADICGFNDVTNVELCTRWMQLGAFYPFSRNHNTEDSMDQDPAYLGEQVSRASVQALTERYRMLPYIYTLMYFAHSEGATVARSLAHEFPADQTTHSINFHFLFGPALLVTPVVEEGADNVNVYFPDARWYNYYSGVEVTPVTQNHTISAPIDGNITLHVRGGYIIPMQDPEVTTAASRQNPLSLLVVLDENNAASGSLFWDDGVSNVTDGSYRLFTYTFSDTLTIEDVSPSSEYVIPDTLYYSSITFYGFTYEPTEVLIDGTTDSAVDISYDATTQVLQVTGLSIDLSAGHVISLESSQLKSRINYPRYSYSLEV